MIHTILDELKQKVLDLKFIERYGGVVVPIEQVVTDEDGREKRIVFPASCDGQGKACYAANDYFELAPNDQYRSVSYWELRGDAVPFIPRRGNRGAWYGFRQSVRLVVWLNLQILGEEDSCNKLSDYLSVLAMNELSGQHNIDMDYVDGVLVKVERKVRKSMDIFGAYSYSDRNELLLYPYDFFAIDFQVEWYIKRDCVPGEVPYKALKCAPIEMPGGGAWTPGGGDDCNCRWIDIPDRPHRLSDFENDEGYLTETTHDALPHDNPHGVTKAQVGLGNVDNTSDADKPVSTAQSQAISQAEADAKQYTDDEINALNLGSASQADVGDFATAAQGLKADSAVQRTDTDVSGNDWVLDEDDMVSDSDTKVPTQQSVKAYVDANAGGSPVNLFTDNLTLTENRVHNIGGNELRILGNYPGFRLSNLGAFLWFEDNTIQVNGQGIHFTTPNTPGTILRPRRYLKQTYATGAIDWLPIQIPEYASDAAADADATLLSGEPYSITGDRTVYRKP